MKNTIVSLLLLLSLGITSCHKTTEVDPELDAKDNPLKEHTLDLEQAKTWLPGQWKLLKTYSMLPVSTEPHVELIFDASQIRLVENRIQIDMVDYEVFKGEYGLSIQTNAQPRSDNWYVRNPGLYMNANRMYLDLGRAQDGPAYIFEKVK